MAPAPPATARSRAIAATASGRLAREPAVRLFHRAQIDDLLHPAGMGRQHQHALAEIDRLHDAVRDEQDGGAGAPPDRQQLVVQPVARDLVERAERLVHQQDAGLAQQRAGDRDALALAARQLVADSGRPARRGRPAPAASSAVVVAGRVTLAAPDLQRQLDILAHRAPRQQGRILEHEADLAARARRARRIAPSTAIAPASGGSRSATTRSKVDLPQPDGPRMVRKSPALDAQGRRRQHDGAAVGARIADRQSTGLDRRLCDAISPSFRHSHPSFGRSPGRRLEDRGGDAVLQLGRAVRELADGVVDRRSAPAPRPDRTCPSHPWRSSRRS